MNCPQNAQQAPAGAPVEITVNGSPRRVPGDWTVRDLLADLGMTGRRVAVEVNRSIVPRGEHAAYRFTNNDSVEIVQAIGGG